MRARHFRISARSSGLGDALGGELGGGAFERPADFDAVANVAHRELGGDKAAGRPRRDQPFLFEPAEHQSHRGAGHLEAAGQRDLADSLAGAELAAEQQLAHLQQGPQGLGFVAPGSWHGGDTLTRPRVRLRPLSLRLVHVGADPSWSILSLSLGRPWSSRAARRSRCPAAVGRSACPPRRRPRAHQARIYNPQDMERTFAIIKPDAVAARYTGPDHPAHRGGRIHYSCHAAGQSDAEGGRRLLRRASRAAVFRQPDGVHVVRARASCWRSRRRTRSRSGAR